jgi:hypothetical protein
MEAKHITTSDESGFTKIESGVLEKGSIDEVAHQAILILEDCPHCDGTGVQITEDDFVVCEVCDGTKKITVARNYLAEAFKIAQDRWHKPIQKEHLIAIIQYCRKMVGAALDLPEVA